MTQADHSLNTSAGETRTWEIAILAIALLALVVSGIRTIASPGIWTHIAVGHDMVQQGIPRTATLTFALDRDTKWVDTTWLYDLFVHGLWQLGGSTQGSALVILAHVITVAGAFAMLGWVARRRGAAVWAVALAVAMAAWLTLPVFTPDPLLVALVFPAFFLLRLDAEAPMRRVMAELLVAQIVWTNLHESFLLGPILAGLFAVDARRAESRGERTGHASRQLWMASGILLASTLANPYFIGLHLWLAGVWTDAARNITLNAAPAFGADFVASIFLQGRYVFVGIVLVGLVAIRQRLSAAATATALLGAFFLVRSSSLAPISAALALPFVGQCLTSLARSVPMARPAGCLLAVSLAAVQLIATVSGEAYERMALLNRFGLGIETDAYPADVASILARPDFPDKCLNLAPDGGFLATRLPGRPVYCDTRGSLYGAGFYDLFAQAMLGDAKALQTLDERYQPGAVLLNCTWPLCGTAGRVLQTQGRWALVYFDGTSALFVRNTPEHQAIIQDPRLHQAGLNHLESGRQAYAARKGGNGNSARLIGAGYFLLGLGHHAEAEVVYRHLSEGSPRMIGAWRGLGIARQQLGKTAEAITALNHANELRDHDPLTLLWLGQALRDAGRTEDADAAVSRARSLNPKLTESFLKNPPPKASQRETGT